MARAARYSWLSHLESSRTGERYDADRWQGLSEEGAPLLARYDLAAVSKQLDRDELGARPADLWRYHELLPVRDPAHRVTLGEGWTPLLPALRSGQGMGLPKLMIKDEGALPTGSFKARGAAVGVSRAHELGVRGIAMPTNGNAGAAWSLYAARAGLHSVIAIPRGAPSICRSECLLAGAEVLDVDGLITDAGAMIRTIIEQRPTLTEVATLREPYRIEGKKTMGYEIAEQLGWQLPDVIIYPAGGGVGLIGIHKALVELRELGWVSGPDPRLVAVQAEGCAPIVDAFARGLTEAEPLTNTDTIAFGINVPASLGDFLMLQAIRETEGTAIAVSDDDMQAEQREIARADGFFVCPEGAACLAAARELRGSGWLAEADQVVVLNTGSGLVYPDAVDVEPRR